MVFCSAPATHRRDESAASYSSAGCTPALPGLRFTSRLHFGTSGCSCKHVLHRKGDWQGLRFAPSALSFGTASSNDIREERKKLQQVSGILVVANRKIA